MNNRVDKFQAQKEEVSAQEIQENSSYLFSGTAYPEWVRGITMNDSATAASSCWTLSFNSLDLELGRDFFMSEKILFHPRMGIGFVKMNQKIHVSYDAPFEVEMGDSVIIIPAQTSFIAHNNFKGVGLRFGTDAFWYFSDHWNLFGKISAGLAEGKFTVGASSLTSLTLPYLTSLWHFRTNFEGGIGLRWEAYFDKGRRHLSLSLGYEISEWYDQNQLTNLTNSFGSMGNNLLQPERRIENLPMQGLTLQLLFNF